METPDLGYLLNRATRHFRSRLGAALSDVGLTPQQAAALMAVARAADGRLTPGAVAEAIETDPATTSGLVDRLARDGWLTSEPNPADRRSRLLALTPQAEAALPRVLAAARTVSAEATASLTPEELATLTSLLRRLGDAEEGGR